MTQYTTTTSGSTISGSYSFPTAYTVGFDRLFSEMSTSLVTGSSNYPPHNIVKVDDDNYVIELAVAGFKQEDLDIKLKDSILTITGSKEDKREYTHKGISSREFTRAFTLGEHVQVKGASLEDGILAIQLEHVVPEDQRPRTIAIGSKSAKNSLING